MDGDSDLLEVVLAAHPVGGFPNFLDCGEEKTNKDRNDGDDDQKLNQGEARTTTSHGNLRVSKYDQQGHNKLVDRLCQVT
jgi:hypothetical protein